MLLRDSSLSLSLSLRGIFRCPQGARAVSGSRVQAQAEGLHGATHRIRAGVRGVPWPVLPLRSHECLTVLTLPMYTSAHQHPPRSGPRPTLDGPEMPSPPFSPRAKPGSASSDFLSLPARLQNSMHLLSLPGHSPIRERTFSVTSCVSGLSPQGLDLILLFCLQQEKQRIVGKVRA